MKIKKLQRAEMAVRNWMEENNLEDFYCNYDSTDYDFRTFGNILLRIETLENYRDDDELDKEEEKELNKLNEFIENEIDGFREMMMEEI